MVAMYILLMHARYLDEKEIATVHGKYLAEEKMVNLENCELAICQNFLANIHRYTKNVFGICTDCSLIVNIYLANTFYLYSLPNIFLYDSWLHLDIYAASYSYDKSIGKLDECMALWSKPNEPSSYTILGLDLFIMQCVDS